MTKKIIKRLSIKPFVRKVIGIMLTIPAVLLVCVFILVGLLLACSPGKPETFLDEHGSPLSGSISEKVFVNINGVEQGMFIMSKDVTHPVLLFLHGGMPDYFLTQKYPTGLEDYFTVVWWEQRGSGLSYSTDIPPETMAVEQLISDTLAVTNYLRHRFGQEKIYLMGHSGEPSLPSRRLHGHQSCTTPILAWPRCRINLNLKDWRTSICFSSSKRTETWKWCENLKQHP